MFSFNDIDEVPEDNVCPRHQHDYIKVCLESKLFNILESCDQVRLCKTCLDFHDSSHLEMNQYQLYLQFKNTFKAKLLEPNQCEDLLNWTSILRKDVNRLVDLIEEKIMQIRTMDLDDINFRIQQLQEIDDKNYAQHLDILKDYYINPKQFEDAENKLIPEQEKMRLKVHNMIIELQEMCFQFGLSHSSRQSRKQSEQCTKEPLETIGTLFGHEKVVRSIIILEDGDYASASRDKTIKIWSKNELHCLQTLRVHTNWVQDLIKIPGDQFASCSDDMSVRIFSKQNTQWICSHTLLGHESYVMRLVYSESNGTLISCSTDGTIRLWKDYDRPDQLNHGNCLYSIATHEDLLCSGDESGELISWSLSTRQKLHSQKAHAGCINTILIHEQIYTCGDDKAVRIWSYDLQMIQQIKSDYELESILYLPDKLITGDELGNLTILDLQSKTTLWSSHDQQGRIYKIYLNSNTICTASADQSIKIYQLT